MEPLDAFASSFKRALREPYVPGAVEIRNVLLVTDFPEDRLLEYEKDLKGFLSGPLSTRTQWTSLHRADFSGWRALDAHIRENRPDLVVSRRLLRESPDTRGPSLGALAELMTQKAACPVLLMPSGDSKPKSLRNVLAVTDHLNGEGRLVDWAGAFCPDGGRLVLAHLEEITHFERVLAAIERIPELDTDVARQTLARQLLHDPRSYIETVRKVFSETRPRLEIVSEARLDSTLTAYRELLETYAIDLLVCDAKDPTRLSMHALGYSLAVEFDSVPTLLL